MSGVVTFGEIMARLAFRVFSVFVQGLPEVECATFAGAEANVAASLSFMGEKAKFVTLISDNDLARAGKPLP